MPNDPVEPKNYLNFWNVGIRKNPIFACCWMMGGSLNQNFCAILRLFFAFLNSDDASGKIVSFAMILFFQIRVFLVEFFKKD